MSTDFTDRPVDVYLDSLPFANHSLMHIIAKMGGATGQLVYLYSIAQVIAGDGRDVTDQLAMKGKALMLNTKYITLIVDAPSW
jgi:hypothetical protein